MLALTLVGLMPMPGCTGGTTRAQREQEEPAVTVEERVVFYRLETSLGPILLELDRNSAPVSVANFEHYANSGGYAGSVFHRVIPGFVVQGGGFNQDLSRRATVEPIVNEWQNGLSNTRGSVAMARMTGQPDSATSQFFFNLAENRQLDVPGQDGAGYAVFGRVVHGMQVVDAIGRVETRDVGRFADVPVTPVRILAVSKLSPAHAADIIASSPETGG